MKKSLALRLCVSFFVSVLTASVLTASTGCLWGGGRGHHHHGHRR